MIKKIKFQPRELDPIQTLQIILDTVEDHIDSIEKSKNPKEHILLEALKEVRKTITRELNIAKDRLDMRLKTEG